jgi:hypothetical protein
LEFFRTGSSTSCSKYRNLVRHDADVAQHESGADGPQGRAGGLLRLRLAMTE